MERFNHFFDAELCKERLFGLSEVVALVNVVYKVVFASTLLAEIKGFGTLSVFLLFKNLTDINLLKQVAILCILMLDQATRPVSVLAKDRCVVDPLHGVLLGPHDVVVYSNA